MKIEVSPNSILLACFLLSITMTCLPETKIVHENLVDSSDNQAFVIAHTGYTTN